MIVAVSDSALPEALSQLKSVFSGTLVHCSGSQFIPGASTWHPLCTFTSTMLSESDYDAIHFVGTHESVPFENLFPLLRNPHSQINREKLALYHAFCVLAGNFTTLLWDTLANGFETELGLPASAAVPYLKAVTANIDSGLRESNVEGRLTGPISRNDVKTIEANLLALRHLPAQAIYRTFLDVYGNQKGRDQ